MIGSRAAQRPLWLIVKQENGRVAFLTIDRGGGRETLPVFSYEEEAETFLWFEAPDAGWWARETSVGELISVLYGPCSGVEKVALDPLPAVDGEMVIDLLSLGRENFVRSLVGEREPSAPHRGLLRTEAPIGFDPSEIPEEKGAWMRENGERRERTRKAAVRYELKRSAGEKNPRGNGDIAIPDYVMWDFGFPEGPHDDPDVRHRVSEVSDAGEDPAWGRE